MAGRPKTRAKRRSRQEYFEGSLGKDIPEEEKQRITAIPVIFRPPRLDDCDFSTGRPIRWGLGVGCSSPAKFENGEELAECVDRYFHWCNTSVPPRPPTVAGLAIALGFKSKTALFQYVKKGEEFEAVVEIALTMIEDYKNVLLSTTDRSPNGIIMDLINNHGWRQRSESTTTTVHEAGSDLTKLLTQLQGSVLRPKTLGETIEDAEFEEVVEPVKPTRITPKMLSQNIEDLL